MKSIKLYNSAILHICGEFANKYFEEYDWHIIGNINVWYWPIEVADYFFSIDEIACALNNNIPKEVLLKWYYNLEDFGKLQEEKINLYNYYLKNK